MPDCSFADKVHQRRVSQHGTAEDVAVAVQILCATVDHQVETQFHGALVDRAGEGIVYHRPDAVRLRE